MMSLASMLNPTDDRRFPSPATTRATPEATPDPPPAKKQKIAKQKVAKDAPVWVKGTPVGKVNYPPFENFSNNDKQLVNKFRLFPPVGTLAEYPRHIPYSSEKKKFLQKTGRDAFEVFHYKFQLPSEDQEYVVMWDYNIGLVRITPFFKCCKYPKTVPGKMLAANHGLKELCYSITGGALAAQGYWMPYDAAKAIAATFCWEIRHALLPLFGVDFSSLCVPPESNKYQQMVIDRGIIESCFERSPSCSTFSPAPSFSTISPTPHFAQPRYHTSTPRSAGQRVDNPRRRWQTPKKLEFERRHGIFSPAQSQEYLSPTSEIPLIPTAVAARERSPKKLVPARTLIRDNILVDRCSAPPNSPTSTQSSSIDISPKTLLRPATLRRELDSDDADTPCEDEIDVTPEVDMDGPDMKAAYMLWQLHMADRNLRKISGGLPPRKKRRASA